MLQQCQVRSRIGLSLFEFAIAVVLLAAVSLYLVNTFATDQQAQAVGEHDAGSPIDMRIVADTIERDIRHAGFMVPASGAACAVDNTTAPDLLYLSNADVLDPRKGATGRENGATIPGDNVATGLNPAWKVALVLDAVADYDNDGDGVADADFLEGGGVIVTDRKRPRRGSACGIVVDVDPAEETLTVEIRSGVLGRGSDADLIAIPAHEYRIGAGGVLSRDGAELARGTTDLQVAFFVDVNQDNVEQAGELLGDTAGPGYVSGDVDLTVAREIRVSTVLSVPGGPAGAEFEFRQLTHTTRELLRNVVMR